MKKILYILVVSWALASCSGPSYFKNPTDFAGGNRAAAVELHCARQSGEGKDAMVYKICEQSFTTHYGK